jgi:hypothetical protein
VPRRLDRTFDLRLGVAVRTHRVQGYDAWHGMRLAGFLDFADFATFVITTLGAYAMRQLALVAVGAFGKRTAGQRIMGASTAGARFGVSPFWIWHLKFLS